MNNKAVVETYMLGFSNGDHAKILSCLTADVIWDIPGHVHLQGKEQFDGEIENDAFERSSMITMTRLIEENNIVVHEERLRVK